ncbi:phosphate-regulating neutral endopeptidase PHEX-like [Dermacentor andersoni]|uniref:phosphate-regulating neutral endopeptidase PHEX-like n=1 Tax=Dermacentor andersoni TaxID=34620 RepID=UPI0021552C60|nr:phosphate-regulating neutral endopeptidase PHEX-like [Dermacentor andersoni]
MDHRATNRPFSYLRPNLRMPSRSLEDALFPNTPRFPEQERIPSDDSEQGQEQEDAAAAEQPATHGTVNYGRGVTSITVPLSRTPASKTPASKTAEFKRKGAKPVFVRSSPAQDAGAKVANSGAAASRRRGINRTPLLNTPAPRNVGARGTSSRTAEPETPFAATTARNRPQWNATVTSMAARETGWSRNYPTTEPLDHFQDQEYDRWPPSAGNSSSAMTTVASVGAFTPTGGVWDDGEIPYAGEGVENLAMTGNFPLATGSNTYSPISHIIGNEFDVKHLGKQCAVIVVLSLLLATFLTIMVVGWFPKKDNHKYGGNVVTARMHPPEGSDRNARVGDEQIREHVVKRPPAPRAVPKATKKPVFTLVDYEDTKAPGEAAKYDFECDTDACRWQSRLVDEKLNPSVDPCVDFYGYVCSAAWDLDGHLPYRAAGRAFVITEVTRYLQEHMHTMPAAGTAVLEHVEQSFLDHSSLLLSSCLNNAAAKDVTQWDGIRGLLRETGLDDWPYSEPPPAQPQQPFRLDCVLKRIDRQLAIFPIVFVSLRKSLETRSYDLHLDAPRNFLFVQYEIQKNNESLPYREILRQVLTLWKALSGSNDLAEDVARFEALLLEASQPFNKAAWKKDVTYPVKKFPRMPKFRVDAYLSHLRSRDDGEVVVLNPVYASKLYEILRATSPRTILNFLGVRMVALVAPLLPQESIPRDLLRLGYPSFQHGLNPRTQSCFHLVERLFPHGVRLILRDILARTTDLDRQWAATIKSMVSSLEHTFRAGTTWMQSVDTADAIKRLKSLQVGYLAGQELEEEVEHYYETVKATGSGPENPVRYYGELLAKSLRKYWMSGADGANYDARFSERFTNLDVPWTRSPESALRLYLTSSTVAAASLVTRSNYPSTLFPLLAADVTRALFLASLDDPQWSSWTRDRFQALQYCLLRRYKHGVRQDNASAANVRDFLADILADNAALKPLMAAFRRFSHGALFVPGHRSAGLTVDRLFFINYAAGFCAPKAEQEQVRERLRYRLGLPPRTRVNLALLDLKEFRDAFKCSHQLGASRCPVWNRDGRDGLWESDAD